MPIFCFLSVGQEIHGALEGVIAQYVGGHCKIIKPHFTIALAQKDCSCRLCMNIPTFSLIMASAADVEDLEKNGPRAARRSR